MKLARILPITMFSLGLPMAVLAQEDSPNLDSAQAPENFENDAVYESLATDFSDLLGDDAGALVSALRYGDAISYESDSAELVTLENNVGEMGFGEVSLTLGLADSLLEDGATHQQVADLLANVEGDGILDMRADGMGWGQIFAVYGTTVGTVMSRLNANEAAQARLAMAHERPDNAAGGRPETTDQRGARPDRPERAGGSNRRERPERGQRAATPERPQRPELPGRAGRP